MAFGEIPRKIKTKIPEIVAPKKAAEKIEAQFSPEKEGGKIGRKNLK